MSFQGRPTQSEKGLPPQSRRRGNPGSRPACALLRAGADRLRAAGRRSERSAVPQSGNLAAEGSVRAGALRGWSGWVRPGWSGGTVAGALHGTGLGGLVSRKWHCRRWQTGSVVANGVVEAVSRDGAHRFSKPTLARIRLLAGLGVEGDAHLGVTVQHRSRVAIDPTQPNLRQVHLMHAELFEELRGEGHEVAPGELGENVTTRGIDLLGLPRDTVLRIGTAAVVRITGLRNPCQQINGFQSGLLKKVLGQDEDGNLVRKAGIMGVVLAGGEVGTGDPIVVELPPGPHAPLERV